MPRKTDMASDAGAGASALKPAKASAKRAAAKISDKAPVGKSVKKAAKASGKKAAAASKPKPSGAVTAEKPEEVAAVMENIYRSPLETHLYFFHEGTDCRAWEIMGAHFGSLDGKAGVFFRVWAPDAAAVSVIGDFNSWDRGKDPCRKISVGVWEAFIEGLPEYTSYKYSVETRGGEVREKADPYAFHAETRPRTASKVYELRGYEWGDRSWIDARGDQYNRPMNVYELHLGSWRRGEDGRMLTYLETAELLIPYVKEMGYTHIELMPVMEHPLDASWGYQVTGYFAATSRFGTPKELMKFVDMCHQAGVGVILDWVPAHFPKDGHGLIEFDGTCCYEYSDPGRREHPDWGTRVFDYGRNETVSFLMSSAMFWLAEFHADGLRVDAVASMLYLDYGKRSGGDWTPNIYGGRENIEALAFIRKLNQRVFESFPHALMIAEESTAWPMVTKPTHIGGLGFNFKWNMGWMNDTLHYMKLDPVFRQYNHNDLTFSMMYAFAENYVLPLSHDEVVHGKCSLIEKMPGYYADKFAGVRACLSYMIAHPGKKMTFMGIEFGQFIEWNFAQSLDWHLLDYEMHLKLRDYVKRLNTLYLENDALWSRDSGWEGFAWITHGDFQGNTMSFRRISKDGNELICLFNFSPVSRDGYRLGVPYPGQYREALNSNASEFGGWGKTNGYTMHSEEIKCGDYPDSILLDLPPYSAVFISKI